VTLDDVRHRRRVLRLGKVSNGVHPTIDEVVPSQTAFWKSTRLLDCVKSVVMPVRRVSR
jgi:hypothetical protein